MGESYGVVRSIINTLLFDKNRGEKMNLYLLAEKLFAAMYLTLGLSLILQSSNWLQLIRDFAKEPFKHIGLMMLMFLFGAFIVLVHNNWCWCLSVIVTFIGWVILIKTALYFWWPQAIVYFIPLNRNIKPLIISEGVVFVIISLLIFYNLL